MSKIAAIVHYELLMAWRRRSLPILWILLLAGVIVFTLLIRDSAVYTAGDDNNVIAPTIVSEDAPEWARGLDVVETSNTIALSNVAIAGMVFFLVGVTLLDAEIIPLDRQFKMRELIDTLPISRAQYLGGKLLSAWAGLALGLLVVGVISAVAIRLLIGVYDVRVFVALWLVLLLPASLLAAALSVLAASFVGSRRGAVMVGLVVMPFVLVLAFASVVAFAGVGALIEPVYAVGAMMMPGDETTALIAERITNTLLLFVGVLLAAWTVVWGWQRRTV